MSWVQKSGSAGKNAFLQMLPFEFGPQNIRGGRKELTPSGYSLNSSHSSNIDHACVCARAA